MNEVATQPSHGLAAMQSAGGIVPAHVNAGAVAIESERAVAEARGKIQIAKMFPRSEASATARFLESCKVREFAEVAIYTVPNRGSGASIRFAEEAARLYGNFKYGHRELSRSTGRSEVEVFAWDMENNNDSTRQITVEHVLDSRNGGAKKLTDQADIDNRIANVASKQMRGRILALLPKTMISLGLAEVRKTLAGDNSEAMSVRVQRMAKAFSEKYGVTDKHLAAYIGHSLDTIMSDELADLQGVFNALKEGAKASDYFDLGTAAATPAGPDLNATIAANKDKDKPAAPLPPSDTPKATPAPRAARTPAQASNVDKTKAAAASNGNAPQQQAKAAPPASDARPEPEDAPPEEGPLF